MTNHPLSLSIAVIAALLINFTSTAQIKNTNEELNTSGRQVYTWQNPFVRPLAISDFYGSGDVNADGVIDLADHALLLQIIGNQKPKNIRCDVDGNAVIDNTDAGILLNHIQNGTPMPSSWDYLQTNVERIEWINKMVSIDKVDENIYDYYYYQCLSYSHELYFQFTHYLSDVAYNPIFPLNTLYNGGQSVFNLPVYIAIINSPELHHAINCILVGDDPLNFYHWRFFEPSDDQLVSPGMWNLPFGSTVQIDAINTPSAEVNTYHTLAKFYVTETGYYLNESNPELVLNRPAPASVAAENKVYQWYPNLLVNDTAYILYDQMRDDMTRRTDIFLKNTETGVAIPITMLDETSLLLDYVVADNGLLHLLFTSRLTKKPGVYYGVYNIQTHAFTKLARISDQEARLVPSGKLLLKREEVYAFWFLNAIYVDMPSPGGIYYNHCNENGTWSAEDLLFPIKYPVFSLGFLNQSMFPYLMEGTVLNNNNLLLVTQSVNNDTGPDYSDIVFLKFNGVDWSIDSLNYPLDNSGTIRCLDMTYEDSRLDLVFTDPWSWSTNEDPAICHVISDDNGQTWSDIVKIDTSPIISANNVFTAPHLIRFGESMFLTYINKDDPSKIIWRKYEDDQWQFRNYIQLPENNYPWFPQIAVLPDEDIMLAWSNSTEGKIKLRQQTISCSLPAPSMPSGPDTVPVYTPTEYNIHSVTDASGYEWILTPPEAGIVSGNDTTATIAWHNGFTGEAFLKVRAYNGCSDGTFSEELPINVTVGAKSLPYSLNTIKIYPNPVKDFLYIDINTLDNPITYQIISGYGEKVGSGVFCDDTTLTTSNLSAGVYFLNLQSEDGTAGFKFVVL